MTTITPQNPFETQATVAAGLSRGELTEAETKPVDVDSPDPPCGASKSHSVISTPVTSTSNASSMHPSPLQGATPLAPRKTNLGLSELSKQLRALQAKNEGQAVEIDRLERQLRILADLQGISVSDLRNALSEACESEAYGELQHRVAALRAQLEAASASKQTVEQDSAAHHIANLQLRVGELEEVEQNLRTQVTGLFKSLKEQTAKASRFESTCRQQQLETDRLREALQETQQQQQQAQTALVPAPIVTIAAQQQHVTPLTPAPVVQGVPQYQQAAGLSIPASPMDPAAQPQQQFVTTSMAPAAVTSPLPVASVPQMPEQRIVPAPPSSLVASSADIELLAETARLAKVEAQVEADKLTVTEQQLEAAEKQYKLREAQFKARSMVQDERIEDLEQQLSSLYVAFEMLRQEHSEDEVTRAALQTSLNEADSRVAQQVNAHDMASSHHVEAIPVAASPNVIPSTPPLVPSTPQFGTVSPVVPPGAISSELVTPIGRHGSILSRSSQVLREDSIVMSGVLLLKSSNVLRPWKKKHATLYQNLSNFQLVLSDVTSTKQDKAHVLEVGVSTLHRYATQRYAFIIRVNPYDKEAPVIFAAAQTENEFQKWMSVLKLATTGNDYNPHDYDVGFGESSILGASNAEDQEASDLEAALRRSTQEM